MAASRRHGLFGQLSLRSERGTTKSLLEQYAIDRNALKQEKAVADFVANVSRGTHDMDGKSCPPCPC